MSICIWHELIIKKGAKNSQIMFIFLMCNGNMNHLPLKAVHEDKYLYSYFPWGSLVWRARHDIAECDQDLSLKKSTSKSCVVTVT